jgi:hypothetical protein
MIHFSIDYFIPKGKNMAASIRQHQMIELGKASELTLGGQGQRYEVFASLPNQK